ncbi:MAG: DUF3991 and toprim domain-containing protein [Clostridiales Family XIII bacterium]|jgi:hypothetical protein|nr:DUF3991 and toprim domain-containing protein [Clostridiales Family XIII bacterium]
MPGVSAEQIAAAKEVDLLSYLQTGEPQELRRAGPHEYRTAGHGSLVISRGLWFWNRGGFGGKTALDYLIKVRGMGFVEAVETVLGSRAAPALSLPAEKPEPQERKKFALPPPARFASHALSYLQGRGISAKIIGPCLQNGTVYESRDNGKVVCVFVGRDGSGVLRFAHMRGIYEKYHRDADGSDKRFGFSLSAKDPADTALAVFEAPVDALSHACLFPEFDGHRLSLGGTSDVALTAFLERNPHIASVSLCLDADEAGQTAARKIHATLAENRPDITVTIDPPRQGKDYNDMLLHAIRSERERRSQSRHNDGFILS